MTQATDVEVNFAQSGYNNSKMEHERSQNSNHEDNGQILSTWVGVPDSYDAYSNHEHKQYDMSPHVSHRSEAIELPQLFFLNLTNSIDLDVNQIAV